MKIKIEEIVATKIIQEREINFPYIAWWSNHKEEIIRIDIEYYADKPNFLKCTIVQSGWTINSEIKTKKIGITNNGVIEEEFNFILRDYANIATEIEFKEFLEKTYNDITKTI